MKYIIFETDSACFLARVDKINVNESIRLKTEKGYYYPANIEYSNIYLICDGFSGKLKDLAKKQHRNIGMNEDEYVRTIDIDKKTGDINYKFTQISFGHKHSGDGLIMNHNELMIWLTKDKKGNYISKGFVDFPTDDAAKLYAETCEDEYINCCMGEGW